MLGWTRLASVDGKGYNGACTYWCPSGSAIGGLPKIRGTFLEVPKIRVIIWVPFWGSPKLGLQYAGSIFRSPYFGKLPYMRALRHQAPAGKHPCQAWCEVRICPNKYSLGKFTQLVVIYHKKIWRVRGT